ncbi:hypothetical protein QOZ80_4AG0305280 [Eleusine coracana subsp. coracana]|nr:hypothetical protein QOZ80_4AG0305280 [Eleusine coracana subsp. coracana]
MGYSIYRVGEDDFVDSDAGLDDQTRPTESPVIRIQGQHPYSWSFAAHDSKIFATQPSVYSPGIPVFDTQTLGVTVCPYPPNRGPLGTMKPLYVSVGGRLLALVYTFLGVLGPEPLRTETMKKPWSWTCVEPIAPFTSSQVSCYAVHPNGRTVFMSVKGWQPNPDGKTFCYGNRNSTFTFDMERLEWTFLGDWLLPFTGHAHYDRELDAWVGLCQYEEGAGHVCCCDVPPAAGAGSQTMPSWKLGEDVLFDLDTTYLGATILYMGESSFCLLECRNRKDDDSLPCLLLVKMTSFVLKYDKEGNLRTTHHRSYASISYQVTHELVDCNTSPVAFWM